MRLGPRATRVPFATEEAALGFDGVAWVDLLRVRRATMAGERRGMMSRGVALVKGFCNARMLFILIDFPDCVAREAKNYQLTPRIRSRIMKALILVKRAHREKLSWLLDVSHVPDVTETDVKLRIGWIC